MVDFVDKDTIRVVIQNFTGSMRGNYYYLSDPPVLADIGSFEFTLNPISFNETVKFAQHYGMLNINITDVNLWASELGVNLTFMGVSDISDYVSRLATYATNTAFNRLRSLSKDPNTAAKISVALSALWEVLPDEI